jgi:parallel beta-helix repeat protein
MPLQAKADAYDVCASGCTYTSIQAAINAAAAGSTITVGPGTYTEQLLIQKNLILEGAGIGQTIVKAPTSGRATAPGYTDQVWTADNWDTDYLLAAYPTNPVSGTPISVKVSGFTFDANGQSHIGSRFTGVYFRKVFNSDIGAAGLFNSEIKGFSASDPSVTGIRVLESSKLTLSGNQVKDYTILGIVVYGTDNLVDPIVTTTGNTLTPAETGIRKGYSIGSSTERALRGRSVIIRLPMVVITASQSQPQTMFW